MSTAVYMQVCSQNAFLKLLAVTMATTPIVLVTGLIFAALTRRGIPSSMLSMFEVLNRLPGALAGLASCAVADRRSSHSRIRGAPCLSAGNLDTLVGELAQR